MSDVDSRAAWVCALWCGVAQRLIRERLAKGPIDAKQRAIIERCITNALMGHVYLVEPAYEALAELGLVPKP